MHEYKLLISGYGKSIAVGTLDKDVHFYWKYNDPKVTTAQLFLTAYNIEKPEGMIEDKLDPVYIPIWRENDDVFYTSGVYPDETHLFVLDQDENIIWSTDCPEYTNAHQFKKKKLSKGFYLQSWRERKGDFGECIIQDTKFDPEKLSITSSTVEDQVILDRFYYDGVQLEVTEGAFGNTDLAYDFFKIK